MTSERCAAIAPGNSAATCDKPKGHDGPHLWYGSPYLEGADWFTWSTAGNQMKAFMLYFNAPAIQHSNADDEWLNKWLVGEYDGWSSGDGFHCLDGELTVLAVFDDYQAAVAFLSAQVRAS